MVGTRTQSGVKATRIQDVARIAGVSTATVSRAISMPGKVSEETLARVREAIDVTGYTINQAAQTLRKKVSRTILVAVPSIENPFFSVIIDAVEKELAARGYNMLITNRGVGENPEYRLRDFIMSSRADGLILFDGALDASLLVDNFSSSGSVPIVIACEEIPGAKLDSVATDNQASSRKITEHLINLGHRKIAHVAGPENNILFSQRHAGYLEALADAGIEPREAYFALGDFSIESGALAARRLLELVDPPTAVFSASDLMAIGVISEAGKMGLSCPAQISVAGFDDIDMAARISPPLTTMRQPRVEIGRAAAQQLVELLERTKPSPEQRNLILESQLVVRGSTGPVPPTP